MYNQNSSSSSEHHKGLVPPRISFSNDFVESSSLHSHSHSSHVRTGGVYRDAPVSSDFEFSVSSYSMMSADELFSKGRLLPLKESCSSYSSSQKTTTTLRDELENEEDARSDENFTLRPPKNPGTRWRGFLGFRKSHIGSKRGNDGSKSEKKVAGCNHLNDDVQCSSKNSQDYTD